MELELHPDKIELQHYSRGVAFLGAYVRPYRKYPSKRTAGFFREAYTGWKKRVPKEKPAPERLRKMLAVLNSYQGHLKHFRSYALLDSSCVIHL